MKRYFGSVLKCALGIFVLSAAMSTSAEAQKQFRWKFSQGDSYSVEVTQNLTQTVVIGDQTVEIPAKIAMTLTWEVDSVEDDGVAELLQTVDRVTVKMTIPGIGKDVQYDSSSKDEPTAVIAPIADVIQPMIGVEFSQKMDASGRVLEVNVPKDAFKGLQSNQLLSQLFSGESFKQMIGKASPVFPAEAIGKSHTWQNEATQKTPLGNITLASKYTYEGEQKKGDESLDKFSVSVTMGFESNGSRGSKVQITDQESKGSMWFDQAAGFLTESSLQQTVGMKVTSGDTIVNQTIESTMTMTVVKE